MALLNVNNIIAVGSVNLWSTTAVLGVVVLCLGVFGLFGGNDLMQLRSF